MRELIDCHVHTACCGHATGGVADIVDAARRAGVSSLVFTEHLPLPEDLDPSRTVSPSLDAFLEYARSVESAARLSSDVEIILGAEADWLPDRPHYVAGLRETAREAGVRVLMGSVHFLGQWAFDDPTDLSAWDSRAVDEVWTSYFDVWCAAARSGLFDVLAHPDLVKKFGHRPSFDPRELYVEAARAASDGGSLIEVSTAGLRKPVGELYPGHELLSAFHDAGVGATVGSDAHAPSEVGRDLDRAFLAMHEAGYRRVGLPTGPKEVRWIDI